MYNYTHYGLYYLRSIARLPENVFKCFMNGLHEIRHVPDVWEAIWSIMFIGATFMPYCDGKRDIIGVLLL